MTGNTAGTHINNIPAAALKTNLGNNLQPANASLVISTLGYISGKVFEDNNVTPNGNYDSGTDTPISGVTINLRDSGNTIIATTTTDPLGNYAFTGLAVGTYSVEEPTQPAGTVDGITRQGTIVGSGGGSAGTPTAMGSTPSRINTIVLGTAAGQIDGSPDNTFAEVVQSSISGAVFVDQNNNGVQNGGDAGIAGVTVNLTGYSYGANGVDNGGSGDDVAVNQSTTTDAGGNYSFTGLAPGK